MDLQVLLENAVRTQKESDGKTTHVIRHMHSNLANVSADLFSFSLIQARIIHIDVSILDRL